MSLIDTTANVTIDKDKARQLWREYRDAKGERTPEDRAIMRAFKAIAQGEVVIQAAHSIRQNGWGVDGFPVLAMTRADVQRVDVRVSDNTCVFTRRGSQGSQFRVMGMPQRPAVLNRWGWQDSHAEAMVPLIPLPVRPKHNLANYWILWEAVWRPREAPHDPLLLRRLEGDLWLVLAAWELTPVERAVLEQSRVRAA